MLGNERGHFAAQSAAKDLEFLYPRKFMTLKIWLAMKIS